MTLCLIKVPESGHRLTGTKIFLGMTVIYLLNLLKNDKYGLIFGKCYYYILNNYYTYVNVEDAKMCTYFVYT